MAYGQGVTSQQKKSVPLLDKYRCRVCEKWKEPASFSNKELNDFTYKYANGTRLNGITARLRCRVCAGGSVTEKQCEGACKMWKDLQKFSKSARRNGGSQSCMACTLWVETQEPGMVTQNPPTGDGPAGDDDDDDDDDEWTASGTFSDPEAGESDSDYEDSTPTITSNSGTPSRTHVPAPAPGTRQIPSVVTSSVGPRNHINVPYNGLAGLSLNGSNNTNNPGTNRTMVTANLSATTMSGARMPTGSTAISGSGAASGIGSRNTLKQTQFDIRSQSSASNPYENSSSTQGHSWGAVDARRRPEVTVTPLSYTGWDNRGQPHVQQRFPSASGSQTQNLPSTSFTNGSAQAPAPVPATTAQNTRNTSWARPAGSRNTQETVVPPPDGARPEVAGTPLTEDREDDPSDSDNDLYDM
ncbi:hypothetical protein BKA65DRAFT_476430 [Rhexocercosporidium sp. MPI-PUGE-AT-0058]|nr:hypothetical protein BKA65DRAFT_476430 [Rhexocercosporidium sp. MPI-PUGE-AT-0058]